MYPLRKVFRVVVFLVLAAVLLPFSQVQAGLLLQATQPPTPRGTPVVTPQATPALSEPQQRARTFMSRLTPEEKVGQLFLVTFKGRDLIKNTQIIDLITKHQIGGVVLRLANDNFTGPDNTVSEAYKLISTLQGKAWEGSQRKIQGPTIGIPVTSNYIPLFVGISQEGDLTPNDQILTGLTPLPNMMALGATWKPALAEQMGTILGKELQAIGFNLFIGPSLDVLEVFHTDAGEDLGTRTYGGDPYWVGEMGKAFIAGLHKGSGNDMVVVAKHFPGRGGSDRPPEEEVATVRKSLEQLKQVELAPFFAVTGNAPSLGTTDGLLVSHIRYQGLQGNIRATTKPVSFDSAALEQIMALKQFSTWRENGGIVVSDDLGSQAVRKFFDPSGQAFDAHQVARNAFLAGNDLLYVDNFIGTGDADTYTTIVRTLDFFAQKYREDSAFAQRVDVSVERLLTLKFRMYPEFTLDRVKPLESGLATIGQSQKTVFDVAQKAVTLINPEPNELSAILPRSPEQRERIIFFTDVLTGKQCSQCPEQAALSVDALQNAVLRLYGPRAGGQILQGNLSSYSFADLTSFLNGKKDLVQFEYELRSADWIIFAMLNDQKNRPESQALRRFLSEKSDTFRNKKVVVFAFNAPYYLDATDISKISAYYGLYSRTSAFVDVAVRILFQEIQPQGALPVSVPGIGYDLITATSPDPKQVINLALDLPELPQVKTTITPSPTPVPKFKVGDNIPLKTGVILDRNKNPVPDGTVVRFIATTGVGETVSVQQIDTVTTLGVARTPYRIQSPGFLEIRVISEPATTSLLLRLTITGSEAAAITAIAPTPLITSTPTATATLTITPTSSPSPTPLPPQPPKTRDWLFSMLIIWGGAVGVFVIGRYRSSLRWGIRWAFLAVLGGLLAYIYLAAGFPGSQDYLQQDRTAKILTMTIAGIVVGTVGGIIWKVVQRKATKHRIN